MSLLEEYNALKKNNAATTGRTSLLEEHIAKNGSAGLNQSYVDYATAKERYDVNAFQTAVSGYADDFNRYSSVWSGPESSTGNDLNRRRSNLLNYANAYRSRYSGDKDARKYFDDIIEMLNGSNPSALRDSYAAFDSAEDYNAAKKDYEFYQNTSVEDYDRLIADLDKQIEALRSAPAAPATPVFGMSMGYQPQYQQRAMNADKIRELEAQREKYVNDRTSKYYGSLAENADFDMNSLYRSTWNGNAEFNTVTGRYNSTGYDDILYDYINRNQDAITRQEINEVRDNAMIYGVDKNFLQQMTDSEIATFNYLYKTQGSDAAYSYIKDISGNLNAKQRMQEQEWWAEQANKDPFGSSVFSVLESPLKGLSYLGQMGDYMSDGTIDQNDGYNRSSYMNSAIRDAVSQNFGAVGSFLYQTGMSMADFLFNTAITGGNEALSLAIMGTGAAADTVISAKDRGLSDGQAFALGTIAGAAEVISEKVSIEALLDKTTLGKNAMGYILKNFLAEGSEEVGSDIVNLMADILVAKDKSEWQQSIDTYKNGGMSDSSAFWHAVLDQAKTMGMDFIGGALSGGIMGAVGVAINSAMRVDAQDYFAELYDGADINQLITEALEVNPDNELAKKIQGKIAEKGKVSPYSIGQFASQAEEDILNYDKGRISEAAKQQLEKYGETGDVSALAAAIAKTVSGEKLTRAEAQLIDRSKYGQRILSELNPEHIRSQEFNTEWAENIGTKRINTREYSEISKLKADMAAAKEFNDNHKAIAPLKVEAEQSEAAPASESVRTGNSTVDAVIEKAGSKELSGNDVRGILADPDAVAALESKAGNLQLGGKTPSEQRNIVRASVQKLAEERVTAAPAPAAAKSSAVDSVAAKYGKQAGAVRHIFNIAPVSDMTSFENAFDAAYQIGIDGGKESAAVESTATQALTETQRRLAYATGKSVRAEQALESMKPGGKKKGAVIARGNITVADLKKRFKSGSNQATAYRVLLKIAEATGFTIELFDSSDMNYKAEQGSFDWSSDVVAIDIAAGICDATDVTDFAKYVMLRTFSHEFTHVGEKWAPGEYNTLRSAVLEALNEREEFDLDYRIAEIQQVDYESKKAMYLEQGMSEDEAAKKAEAEKLSWDRASREVVAEAMTDVLPESRFMEKLLEKDPGLASKIREAFLKFIGRVIEYFKGIKPNDSREAQALKVEMNGTVRYMEGIVKLWDEMALAAVENYNRGVAEQERAAREAKAENITREGMQSVKDSSGGKMFQLRTMKQDLEGYMQDLRDADLVGEGKPMSEADLNYLYKSINRVMDYVENHLREIERSESFQNMDGTNRPFLPYKENSDPHYRMALDYSTLCRKRLLTQAITERLQASLKRALTPVEQVKIRNEIKKLQAEGKKLDVACALCYVEAARLKSPKVINEFLNNKADSIQNYYSLKNTRFKQEVYNKRIGDWKESRGLDRGATKAQVKAAGYSVNELNKFAKEIRKGYWSWLQKADPEAYAQQNAVLQLAESMDNAEFLSAQSLSRLRMTQPDLYDAFISKVRNATRSKAQETDVPYSRGDINSVSDALIEQMNEESGFRHQSWSDFQAMHLLDTISAIIELSTRHAKVHTYTKVADMVRFLGRTGMMMNMSLIPNGNTGFTESGGLDFDPVEGIDFDTMIELREQFPDTAGNIAIGISDEQILALMASPDIDYIIPYHTSGLNADMRRRMGIRAWKDYTKWQNESGDGEAPKLREWFNEKEAQSYADGYEYMVEASKKYLALCAERGLTPKFAQFLQKNSDGSYSLREDSQGYWKLLVDRKMVNQITRGVIIQQAVTPTFDVDTMLDILSEEVNSQAAIDSREAEDFIVNKMLNEDAAFSKADLAQARAVRDAAIRLAIEDSGAGQVQYQARDRHKNVIVDDSVNYAKVRATLQDIFDNPGQRLDFTFPVMRETPFVYEYAAKIPGRRSFVMYASKAYKAMQSKTSDGHSLGVDGLMEAIENLNNPDYIIYQNSGRNAGHYVAIVKINGGDGVVAVDIGNYRNGKKGTINGESGFYDVIVTAYNSLDEIAAGNYETFDDYIDELIGNNDVVYDKEKDEASLHVAISEQRFGRAEDTSSKTNVPQYAFDSQEKSAKMTTARIDYLIDDSGAGSNKTYAQKWISTINPTDFLNMTLRTENQDRAVFDTRPGDYGKNVNEYDYIEGLKKEKRQTPFLIIDENGNVIGHEGRHRMRALEKAGVTSAEIVVQFYTEDGHMDKSHNEINGRLETVLEQKIFNQYETGQSTTLRDIIPLNKDHRDEIIGRYGEGTAKDGDIQYQQRRNTLSGRDVLRQAAELVKTAVENKQNLIVEGCYVPFDWKPDFSDEYLRHIRFICLCMSDRYIDTRFADILKNASCIEARLDDSGCTAENIKRDNRYYFEGCMEYDLDVVMIDKDYDEAIDAVYDLIDPI